MGFFKKLTGADTKEKAIENNDFDQDINYDLDDILEEDSEFEIQVDLYEDEDNLFIKTFIPGIDPKNLNIDVARNFINVSGERINQDENDYDYFDQELAWGKFSKQISLPKEINIEKIKASTKNGLLTLKLSKVDRDRTVKISLD